MPISMIRSTMLCLSGFELYSCWVPLIHPTSRSFYFKFCRNWGPALQTKFNKTPAPVPKILYLTSAYEYQHLFLAKEAGLCQNVQIEKL